MHAPLLPPGTAAAATAGAQKRKAGTAKQAAAAPCGDGDGSAGGDGGSARKRARPQGAAGRRAHVVEDDEDVAIHIVGEEQAVQPGAIPVAGRLRSIRLEDFMCHQHMFVEFSQVGVTERLDAHDV
jgi:hypothetical protein